MVVRLALNKLVNNLLKFRRFLTKRVVNLMIFTIILLFLIDVIMFGFNLTKSKPSILGSIVAGSFGGYIIYFIANKRNKNLDSNVKM